MPLCNDIVKQLDALFRRINPIARSYMHMRELDKQHDIDARVVFLHTRKKYGGDHPGILSLPTVETPKNKLVVLINNTLQSQQIQK